MYEACQYVMLFSCLTLSLLVMCKSKAMFIPLSFSFLQMSKPRSSPRRGGRRSKATPPDTPNTFYDDTTQTPLTKTPAKCRPSPVNRVGRGGASALRKPTKSSRGRGSGKKMSGGKVKESRGRRPSGGKRIIKKLEHEVVSSNEEEEEEEETAEERQEEAEQQLMKCKETGKKVSPETEDPQLLEEDGANMKDECDTTGRSNDVTDESMGPTVGEELMERLSKGGKKKKPMRNCSNCGVQSPVSRAKKCPNCGKNLFSRSSGYSREVTCPRCDYQQRYNGTKMRIYCGRCNNLLTRNYKEESPIQAQNGGIEENEKADSTSDKKSETKDESPSIPSTSCTPVAEAEDSAPVQHESSSSFPVNSDGTYQVGYSCKLLRSGEQFKASEDVEPGQEDSLSLFGNETSQETLRRIIKRKILGEVDQSSDVGSPTKKPCKEEDPNAPLEEKPVQSSKESTSQSQQPSSLAISTSSTITSSTSLTSQSGAVSSPLMEYAQKISARIFIPPEIPPQEVYRKGRPRGPNSRSGKSVSAKNKRLGKDAGGDGNRLSSPVATSPPPDNPVVFSTQDSPSSCSEHQFLPHPPPLVSSDREVASSRTLSSSSRHSSAPPDTLLVANEFTTAHDISESTRAMSPPASYLPPLVSATKPFHDPTINSIRTCTHSRPLSNTGKFYSGQSSVPPLIVTSSYSSSLLVEGDGKHSGQIVTKDLYPGYQMASVPALLPMGKDGQREEGLSSLQPPCAVTHRTVIVDPRNIGNKPEVKDSSAPPVLLSSTSPNPASPDHSGQPSVQTAKDHNEGTVALVSGGTTDKTALTEEDVMLSNKDSQNHSSDNAGHKSKHSKRKQKLHLTDTSELESREGIIYETVVSKKKKKKKKKDKDKDRSEKGHHSKSKSDKHKTDAERKARKKLKKEKRKEREMGIGEGCVTTEEEETVGESQEEPDEETSQCTTLEDDRASQGTIEEGKWSLSLSVSVSVSASVSLSVSVSLSLSLSLSLPLSLSLCLCLCLPLCLCLSLCLCLCLSLSLSVFLPSSVYMHVCVCMLGG